MEVQAGTAHKKIVRQGLASAVLIIGSATRGISASYGWIAGVLPLLRVDMTPPLYSVSLRPHHPQGVNVCDYPEVTCLVRIYKIISIWISRN